MSEVCVECGEVPRGPVCSRGRNAFRPHKLVSTGWSVKSPPGGGAVSPRSAQNYAKQPSLGGVGASVGSSPEKTKRRSSRSRSKSRRHRSSSRGRRSSRSPSRKYSISPPSGSIKTMQQNQTPSATVMSSLRIWPGATVERNPAYWVAGDVDGGPGNRGTVVDTGEGWVKIRWDHNHTEATHRWGAENAYDVSVVAAHSGQPTASPSALNTSQSMMEGSRQVIPASSPEQPDTKVYCRVQVEAIRNVKKLHYKLPPTAAFSQLLGELFTQLSLKPSEWNLTWTRGASKTNLEADDTPLTVGMSGGLHNIHQLVLSPRVVEDEWMQVGGNTTHTNNNNNNNTSSPMGSAHTAIPSVSPVHIQSGVVAELLMRPVSPVREEMMVSNPSAMTQLREENHDLRAKIQSLTSPNPQQQPKHAMLGPVGTHGVGHGAASSSSPQPVYQVTSPLRGVSPARWDPPSAGNSTGGGGGGDQTQAFGKLKEAFMAYLSFGLTLPVTETERFLQFVMHSGVPAQCGVPDQTIKILVGNMLGPKQRAPLAFEEFTDALNLVATVIYPRDEYPLTRLLPSFRVG